MSDLWKKFFLQNPWEGFEPDPNADQSGWHSDHPVFGIATLGDVRLIIEVGSWKGASAITLLENAPDADIICVDTWLGGVEHWDMPDDPNNPDKGWTYHMAEWKHGRPQLYRAFMSNIANKKLQDRVIPISQTSDNAARIIEKTGLKADVIYIDGSHEYEDVIRDLENYWKLLNVGGVMFGDDIGWPGVKKAVDQFSGMIQQDPEIYDNNYFFLTKERA